LYCHGETVEETRQQINEAIEFHLRGLREDGLPIPQPDEAVCASYGRDASITDEEILSRLLTLNRQRGL
jgi:predicted RNase H-like HicB family nuclease